MKEQDTSDPDPRCKVAMGTQDWLLYLEYILVALAKEHSDEGVRFTFSETLENALPGIWDAGDGTASYHYTIDGVGVKVAVGPHKEADLEILVDYRDALVESMIIYTPAFHAARASGVIPPLKMTVNGDLNLLPHWLHGIHNLMAAFTSNQID